MTDTMTTELKNDAPRTMTLAGLRFLQALAAERQSGCFLEIGPLFGSSTNAIDAGRKDDSVPIHTIDTFENAPWVRKRLGLDLSREAFETFTTGIRTLNIHQGFAPGVVRDTWKDKIGFYFDDATHGDPGWTDNYKFFSPYFTRDAIICGDDFAGGWPDIVRNVQRITEDGQMKLYVIGRVWAFTAEDDHRIANAVHSIYPKLKGTEVEVHHGDIVHCNIAGSWSWGLHRQEPLTEFRMSAPDGFEFGVSLEREDGTASAVTVGREPLVLDGMRRMTFAMPRNYSIQFCVRNGDGKTENTKDLRTGSQLAIGPNQRITALRIAHR